MHSPICSGDPLWSPRAGTRPAATPRKFWKNQNYKILFWAAILAGLLLGAGGSFSTAVNKNSAEIVINEILASNGLGLTDEDGDFSDWIEIYNPTNQPVNLSGWSLTDDPDQPEKWLFPDITLSRGEYLLIFASGKNRYPTEPALPLHTNFKLNKSGDFLGLYRILDQRFINAASTRFPAQFRDIAYGRYGDPPAFGYLARPTPGGPNDETLVWMDVTAPVEFSVERGFYEAPFRLELTTGTPEAVIRYTTDGSQPTETNGSVYAEPFAISGTTIVRAAAFKPGFLPSYVDTHTYIFLDDVLTQPADPAGFPNTWGAHPSDFGGYTVGAPVIADYAMDREVVRDPRYKHLIRDGLKSIPSLSIATDIQNFDIYANPRERGPAWERPVSVELIYPDGRKKGFQINAGLRIHGGESRWEYIPKHSFRILFTGQYGPTKLEYPLYADSPVKEFDKLVLRGGTSGYAGKPLTNHKAATYTRDEWLRASQIEMSGVGSHGIFVHLYLNGLYWGLYNVTERIDESFMASYLGGEEKDWFGVSSGGIISGSSHRFDALIELARNGNLDDPQKYAAVKSYLDTAQFIDYILLNWYAGNRDWPGNNWYAGVQNPAGKVNYFVWDGENSWVYGSKVYLGKANATVQANPVKFLFEALIQNPDFKIELADRAYRHLFNDGLLTDARAQARWLEINSMIDTAIIGESARWGDVRFETPITRADWLNARDRVLAQMEGNAGKLITLLREAGYYPEIDPPIFSRAGGLVDTGFTLTLTPPPKRVGGEYTIYYTLDGSDPRLPDTGEVAPKAVAYDGPLLLTTTVQVKARLLDGNIWSALTEATFNVIEQDRKLRITEIMYNPVDGNDYEFIELKNNGDADVEVSNMSFEGINFTFPPGTPPLRPGRFIVLVSNPTAFAKRYPGVVIGGVYSGRLSNAGEKISLTDPEGKVLVSVTYDDENRWPVSPDGRGDSLVMVQLDGDPNNPKNWRASANLDGSPGADDPVLAWLNGL